MAQKVTVDLLDDLDGSTADESVAFGLDGVTYTIDLSEDNAAELRDALVDYVSHGTRTGGRKKPAAARTRRTSVPSRTAAAATTRERTQTIRAWAREHGYDVSDRGRLPRSLIEEYDAHH